MVEATNWTAYNAAQTEEKRRFVELLSDLCGSIEQPAQGKGRPRLPLSDMTFAAVYKVYCGFSSRRFTSDLRDACAEGLVDSTPHFNSVSRYMANPMLTPILREFVTVSSLPLKAVETDFAVDSSGFSTSRFVRWYDHKHGRKTQKREWLKVHLVCGVKTNVVTAVDISGPAVHDSYFFVSLLKRTAKHFDISEVSADKAYLSRWNMDTVDGFGGTPFLAFKNNTAVPKDDSVWARMYHYFMFNRDEYMARYHKRSNAEAVFSAVKAKFGDAVRSKSDEGQVNEVLAKVLCHNMCVLIRATRELDVE
jgi:transposase